MTTPSRTHEPRLGATVGANGRTRFVVWAPDATTIEVALDAGRHGLDRDGPYWSAEVAGVAHGDRYRYVVDGAELPDPASRWQPDGVHGPSAVVDESVFQWHDDDWTGTELAGTVLYEMHVGTFTAEGTFEAASRQLSRLRDLGVTAVEVMPVAAFPGTRNWGYDGVFPYAVQDSYGGPVGLARFVDAAHRSGLAVILDVVYNHLGPEGNVLGRFGPYFTDSYRTPWGDAVNVAGPGSDHVRRYFIDNAVGWIRDFHLDGLRLDAVHAIVDPTPVPFVQELTRAVHAAGRAAERTVLVTIESSANDPRIVRSEEQHGWGCDAVWDDDVHHALRVALTGERREYYRAYSGTADLATAWQRRWVYTGRYSPTHDRRHGAPADDVDHQHFVVFDTNHDHVGNTPDGARMLASADPGDPRHRLAAAAILLSPFTPLLFMGEEYGETAPFPYFVDHGDPDLVEAVRRGRRSEFTDTDWSGAGAIADPADPGTFASAVLDATVAEREPHRSRLAMYSELLRIRRNHPVLTDPTARQEVSVVDDVMLVVRSTPAATASLTFNFSPVAVERPAPGPESVIVFDTDDVRWGGAGQDSTAVGAWSARLRLVSR